MAKRTTRRGDEPPRRRRKRKSARPAAPKRTPKKSAPTAGQTAYQRRIARAMAQGKTLQEARGHKPKEHIARRQRELAEGETTYQRGALKKFAEKQARRSGRDPEDVLAELRNMKRRHGWDGFNRLRDTVNALHRNKRVRFQRWKAGGIHRPLDLQRAKEQRDRNVARMQALADELGLSFDTLFYR